MRSFKEYINEGEKRDTRIAKSSNPDAILARLNQIHALFNKGIISREEATEKYSSEAKRAKNLMASRPKP
jgi:hypothetical protein